MQTKLNTNANWLNTKKGITPRHPVDHAKLIDIIRTLGKRDPDAKAFVPIHYAKARKDKNKEIIEYTGKAPGGYWEKGITAEDAITMVEAGDVIGVGLIPSRLGLCALDIDGPYSVRYLRERGLLDEALHAANEGIGWTSGGDNRFTPLVELPDWIQQLAIANRKNRLQFANKKFDVRVGDVPGTEAERAKWEEQGKHGKTQASIQVVLGGSTHHLTATDKAEYGYGVIGAVKAPVAMSDAWWNKLMSDWEIPNNITRKPEASRTKAKEEAAERVRIILATVEAMGNAYTDNGTSYSVPVLCHESESGNSCYLFKDTGLLYCHGCDGSAEPMEAYRQAALNADIGDLPMPGKGRKKSKDAGDNPQNDSSLFAFLVEWMNGEYYFNTDYKQWFKKDSDSNVWRLIDGFIIVRDLIEDFPNIPFDGQRNRTLTKAMKWAQRKLSQRGLGRTNLIPYANACLNPVTLERVDFGDSDTWEVTEDGAKPIPDVPFPEDGFEFPIEWLYITTMAANGDFGVVLTMLALIRAVSKGLDFAAMAKALMLIGKTGTAKSIQLNILSRVASAGAKAASVDRLSNAFFLATLIGRTVITIAEGKTNQAIVDLIKSLISGDPMPVDVKGVQTERELINRALVAFATNTKVWFKDDGGALARRFITIHFIQKIVDGDVTGEGIHLMHFDQLPGLLALADMVFPTDEHLENWITSCQGTVDTILQGAFVNRLADPMVEFLSTQCVGVHSEEDTGNKGWESERTDPDGRTVSSYGVNKRILLNHYRKWCEHQGTSCGYSRIDSFCEALEDAALDAFDVQLEFDDVRGHILNLNCPQAGTESPRFDTDNFSHAKISPNFPLTPKRKPDTASTSPEAERLSQAIIESGKGQELYEKLKGSQTLRRPNNRYHKLRWKNIRKFLQAR